MRPLRSLLLYLAAIFLGAALLAPWLYWLVHWVSEQSHGLDRLSAEPFQRYVHRSLIGVAVVGLWPFLRSIGFDSWTAIGLPKPKGNWHRLAAGFLLGFASLACVAALALVAGARTMNADLSAAALLKRAGSAGLTAIIVGVLEEVLFRGALFGALRKVQSWPAALAASSAIYALVHFFQKSAASPQITWSSGLELLPRMCRGFVEFEVLVPAFFTLLLAGIILGLAYERSGNLYLSIGLHAGWIFWLKFYGAVTVAGAGASQSFWGSGKLIDGWLALALLLPVLVIVRFFPFKKDAPADEA